MAERFPGRARSLVSVFLFPQANHARMKLDFGMAVTDAVHRAVVGALGCGQIADWLGRRMVVLICLVISFAAITMEFVATTNELFFGGKFLNGFAVGALASVTVTYIGEVSCSTSKFPCRDILNVYVILQETDTNYFINRWPHLRSEAC